MFYEIYNTEDELIAIIDGNIDIFSINDAELAVKINDWHRNGAYEITSGGEKDGVLFDKGTTVFPSEKFTNYFIGQIKMLGYNVSVVKE